MVIKSLEKINKVNMMKTKYILKGILAMFLLVVLGAGCDSYNEAVLSDIENSRLFSPVLKKPQVRNRTNVELDWQTREEDDHYVIEFSENDPNFTAISKTVFKSTFI